MTGSLRVGIQADDLTGACDTGAAFAARGLETLVLLPEAPDPSCPPPVLVLDTETRVAPADDARRVAREALARLALGAPEVLYKKVDSTLRGALAAELAGGLEGAGRSVAVLAPAFPAQRRTVVDGMLRVDGHPADETAVARDPRFPATGASVLALVGVGGPYPVGALTLATVRRGPEVVAVRLDRGAAVLVCDAETDDDLAVVARATVERSLLLAGSAGLAAALARRMGRDQESAPPRLPGPLLVVAGSPHPVTRAQIERLAATGVGVAGLDPLPGAGPAHAADGADRILTAPLETAEVGSAARTATAARLGAAARRLLADEGDPPVQARYGTLVLTGGETAVAVCRALGASGLVLDGELEPGLPHGRLRDGPFAGLPVVTKGGGFGDPDALVRCRAGLA